MLAFGPSELVGGLLLQGAVEVTSAQDDVTADDKPLEIDAAVVMTKPVASAAEKKVQARPPCRMHVQRRI